MSDTSVYTIKIPEYECPIHGIHGRRMTFHATPTYANEANFCTDCLRDKFIELGVSAMTMVVK